MRRGNAKKRGDDLTFGVQSPLRKGPFPLFSFFFSLLKGVYGHENFASF